MNYKEFLKKSFIPLMLIFIFLFSYYIRSINIVPDRLLSFDPIFFYRYTKYIVDYGHLPAWDELSYYVGRAIDVDNAQPFMLYLTALLFNIGKGLGMSLMTFVSRMSAIYGALIIIPAYLLTKELSNKYGGLMGALLVGTAPQILVRTFGGSYDNDQLVTFFLLLNLYLGLYAFRNRSIKSFCVSLIGFAAFMMMWGFYVYPFIILCIFAVVYILTSSFFKEEGLKFLERIKKNFNSIKNYFIYLIELFIGLFIVGKFIGSNFLLAISKLFGFAQQAERWIVNISIAELQPFNIFSIGGWILSTGRFAIGDSTIDSLVFLIFAAMVGFSLYYNFKNKNKKEFAFLLTLFLIGIYTTFRGIRFTEFTSALFLVIISCGFGYFWVWSNKNSFNKTISLGTMILIGLVAMSISLDLGKNLGPDYSPNWDSAWNYLSNQTPELSLVGTWWDPGHMITGLAEKRVIADGAHCQLAATGEPACLYTINDRIVDLGRIMATDNETVSMNLIKKYQGDSPKVYWIASEDLVGKFQWLQYFGLGCDARTESRCPLYMNLGLVNAFYSGSTLIRSYGADYDGDGQLDINVFIVKTDPPAALFIQNRNAIIMSDVIFYDQSGYVKSYSLTDKNASIQSLKPLEGSLNIRLVNSDIPYSIWISESERNIVLIPPTLKNSVFTRMFFLEGNNLLHFKQVFKNEEVKIYEVIP